MLDQLLISPAQALNVVISTGAIYWAFVVHLWRSLFSPEPHPMGSRWSVEAAAE
ncbi:hypothetical protein [Sinomonas terrae]|uniref:Uncharacterized protein n=1 Tax=Sinomonas terrae TaxID=2908838 RepID=A0ABS9U5K5_9MICC|nr:hypothetical protein [Sinomonas terrae]MCH6471565.1 hypothetical protein [Sinomonas terrae]